MTKLVASMGEIEPQSHEDTKILEPESKTARSKAEPELRFAEFVSDWSSFKLGDISKFSKGKGISKADIDETGNTECIRYGQLYTEYGEVIDNVISRTKVSSKNLVLSKKNDVIIPASGETSIDIATASCVQLDGIALGGDLNIIRTEQNGAFLAYYLNNKKKTDIAKFAQGNSVVHLYGTQLGLLSLNLPSNNEQQKIADFLSSVDKKIEQLTEKHRLLTEYKKGVMQQLFTQQIRFKDNQGNDYPVWSLRGVGSVFEQRAERYQEGLELLSVTMNKGVKRRSEIDAKDSSSENKSNYKKVCIDDVVYNSMRMWQGASGVSSHEGVVSPAYTVLKGNESNVSSFFGYYFKTTKMIQIFQRNSQGLTSDTWNLKYKPLSKIKILVPVKEEQQTIANFLTEIDQKIDQVWSTLEQTKAFKKGLLQKMFV